MFDDFGKAALGATGQRLVYVTVYGTILLNPIIFQLTSVESLQQVFYQHKLPAAVAGLIVVAIIIPLAQVWGFRPFLSFCYRSSSLAIWLWQQDLWEAQMDLLLTKCSPSSLNGRFEHRVSKHTGVSAMPPRNKRA